MITQDEVIEKLIEELIKNYHYSSSWFLFKIIPSKKYFELKIERSSAGLPYIVRDYPKSYSIESPYLFKTMVTYNEFLSYEDNDFIMPENSESPSDFKNQLSSDSKFILIQGLTEILYLKNLKEDFNLEPEKTFLSTKAIDTGLSIKGVIPENIAHAKSY